MATKTKKKKKPERKQPETLRMRECSASFTVNDLHRSIAWYRDILGFVEGERWEEDGVLRGVQMKAGAVDLMLNQDDFAKGRDRVKGAGFRLWCNTVQDIDRLAADIKARGGTLTYEPRDLPWGDRAFALTDPDGFQITIVQA
ncbi:MAG: VOC family protein [Gemmatimonadetes bacterium]|nr:VOC family protein [Gemmatimonadota bacterium]